MRWLTLLVLVVSVEECGVEECKQAQTQLLMQALLEERIDLLSLCSHLKVREI
jgi:hypothetical protein